MDNQLNEFLLSKYQALSAALNRIKEDEQRWVGVLLLVYGAILTFTTQTDLCLFESNILFGVHIITTLLFAIYWIWHATNLRVQYFRVRLSINEIERRYTTVTLIKEWSDTRPFESKLAEITLSIGLFFISNVLLNSKLRIDLPCIWFWILLVLVTRKLFIFWILADLYRVESFEFFKSLPFSQRPSMIVFRV